MKRRLQLLLLGIAAACGLAAATLKPGYAYHGNLRPTDQVPTNYEAVAAGVVSNVLDAMDLTPVVVTDVVVVVSNVFTTTNAEHWITNNVMDEYRTVVVTNTMLTNVHHYVTNTVVHNTVQSFEHWHTNYTHEVTNVYHYETTELTNIVREVELVPYTNYVYVVTNFVERTNYYHYVTNEIHEVTFSHHTNYVDNVISNFWSTNYVDNVISNLYVTNYTENVISNLYIVSNFVEHTWHTNNRYIVNNIISNFTEHTWHTNYDTLVIYETTNHLINVTTQVDRVIHETNITTEVTAVDVTTNYYVGTIGDSICFTNGTSLYLLEANNKRYAEYRRVTETRDRYWTAQKFAHLYGTNMQEVSVVPSYSLTVPDVFIEGSNDAFVVTALSDGTAANATFRGSVRPALLNDSVTDGYVYTYLAMRVDGGWLSVAQDGTTNYCTSATAPALGDWLLFPTAGLTGTGVMPSFYKEDGSSTSFGCYLLSGEDVLGAKGGSGDLYYTSYTVGSGKGALKSGKNGTSYTGTSSGSLYNSQFMKFDLGTTPATLTSDAWVLARVRSLVAYDEMTGYVDNYVAWHAVEDVVTNRTFIAKMEAAMAPYTLASYSNSVRAAESAAGAAGSAQAAAASASALDAFQSSAQNMLSSYVDQATTRATTAANTATSMKDYAKTYMNSALAAANYAFTTLVTIQDEYAKVETFTNWFYQTANSGKLVTNMHYHVYHWDVTDDRRDIDGTISITDTRNGVTVKVPYKVRESGASGVQWPNSSFTFLTTYSGYATAGNGDTLQIVYTNDTPGTASDVYVHGNNYLLHQASFTLLLKKNTNGDPTGWRVYRATSSYMSSDIRATPYDYDLRWMNAAHLDLADGWSASGNPTYSRIPYGLAHDVRNMQAATPDLALYATNTYDMVTNLALYATNTYDMVTNLALYATNTYSTVTNLAVFATNTYDTATNAMYAATNGLRTLEANLPGLIDARMVPIAAWVGSTRVTLDITSFRGHAQTKGFRSACLDSPPTTASTIYTLERATDVNCTGAGTGRTRCDITPIGWYASGATSNVKMGFRLDYNDGGVATNWLNTGVRASVLFATSGCTRSLSGTNIAGSQTGTATYSVVGTLTIAPSGTY